MFHSYFVSSHQYWSSHLVYNCPPFVWRHQHANGKHYYCCFLHQCKRNKCVLTQVCHCTRLHQEESMFQDYRWSCHSHWEAILAGQWSSSVGLKKTIIHQPNHPLKIAMSDSPNWSYYNYRKPINKAKRLTTVILMPRQLCYYNTTAIACSYQIFSS